MMDIASLKRDAKKVSATFQQSPDGVLLTRTGCKIMIPARFVERRLANLGSNPKTIGVCAYIVGNEYSISLTNAFIPLSPTAITEVMVGEDGYILFHFEPNTVVSPSLDLVKDDGVVYRIFDEMITKSRVPWYMTYLDLLKIFNTAKKHAGTNIGSQQEVTALIASNNARSPEQRELFYRQWIRDLSDIETNPPVYNPLMTVELSASNTVNKLTGSYMTRGIIDALNHPATRTEKIEELLRR